MTRDPYLLAVVSSIIAHLVMKFTLYDVWFMPSRSYERLVFI